MDREEFRSGFHAIGIVHWKPEGDFPHGYVASVYAITKGHGFGTKVMEQICTEADKRQLPLTLFACPDKIEMLPQLIRWYQRFGFKSAGGNIMNMQRNPKERESNETRD